MPGNNPGLSRNGAGPGGPPPPGAPLSSRRTTSSTYLTPVVLTEIPSTLIRIKWAHSRSAASAFLTKHPRPALGRPSAGAGQGAGAAAGGEELEFEQIMAREGPQKLNWPRGFVEGSMIALLLLAQVTSANADKLQQTATFKEGKSAILCLAFSPNGTMLASGEVDRKIRLWDLATGKQTAVLEGHQKQVAAVAFSPDGSTLASARSEER